MVASIAKIKELLSNGMSNEVVANAVGVDPSYISQLMSDDNFKTDVVNRRATVLAAATDRDRTWDSAEDKLLVTMHELIDNQAFYKPQDVLRAIAVVNQAKRRGVVVQDTHRAPSTVVTLNLPTVVVHNFQRNTMGEIIEVDGQTLVSMPASQLMANLARKTEGKNEHYEQVRKYLPPTAEVKDG